MTFSDLAKKPVGILASLCLAAAAMVVSTLGHAATPAYRIETVVQGLDHPWSLAFLPDGRMLVTERVGRLRVVDARGQLQPQAVANVPVEYVDTQAGLMDVAVDPDFATNRFIYLTYAYGNAQANNTRLVRAKFDQDKLTDVQTLFSAKPTKAGGAHFGGRIAFLPDGTLVLTLGDGFDHREQAQNLSNHLGKTVRLNRDGSVPANNPYVKRPGAAPEIYTTGHRNVQGIVYDSTNDRLYINEHGPRGGDELNILEAGSNYGWPIASLGLDYTGARVTPYTQWPGMRDGILHWTPSVAPSGMALYQGSQFAQWQGDLFMSTLAERSVRRIAMHEGLPTGEQEVLFADLKKRIRDVRSAPDGALYLLTDEKDGSVLRVMAP